MQQEKDGQPRDISNPFESRAIGQTERQYTGEPLTLNLKDADIKDTLQKFSELTNLNIVLDPDVRGTVTVSLTDIPWDQALELILKINGLGYVLEGNVMRIAGTQKLASEEAGRQSLLKAQENNRPTKTVIQKLSYATADAAAATAKKVMSARGDIFVDDALEPPHHPGASGVPPDRPRPHQEPRHRRAAGHDRGADRRGDPDVQQAARHRLGLQRGRGPDARGTRPD